jgi:hypothetical protein
MTRQPELDALRGIFLVLMVLAHLPTSFAVRLDQPFGYVSSAEGFVFLSAFLAGQVYTERARKRGLQAMRKALWRRVAKLYCYQAGLLIFAFTAIAAIGVANHEQAVRNLLSFYFQDPKTALWSGFVLLYNPPLLDILPIYVMFMAATPLVLSYALRRGWMLPMALGLGTWLLAQFGLREIAYNAAVAATGLKEPLSATGAFDIFAWQFLWLIGLRMGSIQVTEPQPPRQPLPPWSIGIALTMGIILLIWRHLIGQVPFMGGNEHLNLLFDKWHLGPFRLLNFCALLVLTLHYGPGVRRWIQVRFLVRLGEASLAVFCGHLVLCLLMLGIIGDRLGQVPWWGELAMIAASLLLLYAFAEFRHARSADARRGVPLSRSAVSARRA